MNSEKKNKCSEELINDKKAIPKNTGKGGFFKRHDNRHNG